jgi:soluble lytic murein transglycosylase-like protein
VTLRVGLALVVLLAGAAPARAELVYFTTGRTLSVKSFRLEGPQLVLILRGGGEIVCDRTLVDRIEADEVPYPEEAIEAPADGATVVAAGPEHVPGASHRVYAPIVAAASARHGVDATLVHAVIQVESAYRPRARSRKGAMGLMQLMPATVQRYQVSDPYDPRSNIEAGVRHLKTLLDEFPLTLALAAYNAGEGAVRRFGGVPPYAETRNYVTQVLRRAGR